ncbi:alpha-amylase family glycosyl hydrolase [candidate division CSSED10-310 bacterium]|uniref:Alpha-amylase n=1 Tax=candidate division CSSED10-310 bacterium TaxID=2855610 RepID=A0ABV6Z3G8_UNCC1
MPVCESPSYHGYDVTNYRVIEKDYGTEQDFLDLMAACDARGIRVIVDFVMNHTSNHHPWFQSSSDPDSAFFDWYRWSNTHPGYTGPWGQPVWHQHQNGLYYYGLFWSGMPDLNYTTPAVKQEMFDVAAYWLTEMRVAGFRCDAAKYIYEDGATLEDTAATFSFWEDFQIWYKTVNPEAMAVGEVWDRTDVVVQYVGSKFDFCFEFDLASLILHSISIGNPTELRSTMAKLKTVYPYHQYGTFLTNHDQDRVFDVLQGSVDRAKLAASIYLTLPGIPYLYYGEEIAMAGVKPDEDIRRPMQWNAETNGGFTTGEPWHDLNPNYPDYNVADMQSDPDSIWHHY